MCEKEPAINAIFYKSAFLSCIEDRRCGRSVGDSISTIRYCESGEVYKEAFRDHAHILVEFIDAILQCMFDGALKETYDLETIGIFLPLLSQKQF